MHTEKGAERDQLKKHVDDIVRLMELQIESAKEKQSIIEGLLVKDKTENPIEEEETENIPFTSSKKVVIAATSFSLLALLGLFIYLLSTT